jgi:hypothetical protein
MKVENTPGGIVSTRVGVVQVSIHPGGYDGGGWGGPKPGRVGLFLRSGPTGRTVEARYASIEQADEAETLQELWEVASPCGFSSREERYARERSRGNGCV